VGGARMQVRRGNVILRHRASAPTMDTPHAIPLRA
jgi:hypothetical protein